MRKTVMPGEAITTEEEFLAGENTFAENGLVKSATLGEAELNHNTKEASVRGKKIEVLEIGDIVYGVITTVKENTVMVELRKAENNKKITISNAQIPVRNISNEYVSKTRDYYRIGDIVKGVVSKIDEFGIDLETKGPGLGVIKAYCSKCRHEMEPNKGQMMCLNCGNLEGRKWFENNDERTERPRDGNFGERRSFGGDRRPFNREKSFDRNRGSGERRSFGGNRDFGNKRSFSGERKPFNPERRSFSENRENKSSDNRGNNFNSNGRNNFRGHSNENRNYKR